MLLMVTTIQESQTKPATIDDLYRVPGKAEIVNGEIVHMSPTGFEPGYARRQDLRLAAWIRQTS